MATADKMYQLVWLKAFDEGEVRIALPTEKAAVRARMALYNAVQQAKKFPMLNPRLADAVEHCLVCLEDEGRTVVVQRKDTTVIGEAVLGALGMTAEELRAAPLPQPAYPAIPKPGASQTSEIDEANALRSLAQNSDLCGLIIREG